jgi:hypothetical protein
MSPRSIRAYNDFTGRKPAPSITPSCFGRRRVDPMKRCAEDVQRFDATGELPEPWGAEPAEESQP